MANAWLPGDTRQRIQDLIKGNNTTTTQADLAEIIGLMILRSWGYQQKRQNFFTPEDWIPVC